MPPDGSAFRTRRILLQTWGFNARWWQPACAMVSAVEHALHSRPASVVARDKLGSSVAAISHCFCAHALCRRRLCGSTQSWTTCGAATPTQWCRNARSCVRSSCCEWLCSYMVSPGPPVPRSSCTHALQMLPRLHLVCGDHAWLLRLLLAARARGDWESW